VHSFHNKGDVVKLAPTLVAGENLGTDAETETGTYLHRCSVHASLATLLVGFATSAIFGSLSP
jgi:hypothetical protein